MEGTLKSRTQSALYGVLLASCGMYFGYGIGTFNTFFDFFIKEAYGITDEDIKIQIAGNINMFFMLGGFIACRAVSERNDDPQGASRPFDRTRDGFVYGEGAGVVVVESAEHAQRRGARILAEIVGAALTADAYHISAPEPTGRGAERQ